MNRRHHLMQLAGLASLGFAPLAHAQSFTMKLSATTTEELGTDWLNAYKANLEAATQGKVKGQVYPSSQLGTAQRTVEGVSMGTIEMVLNASGMYEGLDPRFAALAVPGMFDSLEQGVKVLADPEVRTRLSTIASGKGVEFYTTLVHSQCSIVSRKPVRQLSDLKGMKIRVPGSALVIAQLRKLGANPISMSLGEVLPAFQNGTVDGVYSGTPIPSALKYFDVAKAQTLLPSTFICIVGLVSPTFLKSTGPMEAALREAARKTDAEIAPRVHVRIAEAKTIWEKGGGEFINLSAADTKTYLDTTIPAALAELTPEGRADYDVIRRVGAKYRT
ncbi:DctP family TRAP transporter solute-binding subunit [soil metagenome]